MRRVNVTDRPITGAKVSSAVLSPAKTHLRGARFPTNRTDPPRGWGEGPGRLSDRPPGRRINLRRTAQPPLDAPHDHHTRQENRPCRPHVTPLNRTLERTVAR
ncbi:hypothetical protein GCM10022376_03780 [Yimella lutea]